MIDYKSDDFVSILKDRDKATKIYNEFKRLAKEKRLHIRYLRDSWKKNGIGGRDADSIIESISSAGWAYEVCAKKIKNAFKL